ncbi:hypothetical protein [Acidocella aminolytica]|uniref:hypothetical protein n=1 Tax=Acidocella aminolytica TaxID=33998 RepID=UPI0011DCAEC8|nr:hypothetical protein [Acidocella aminolytica]
MLTGGRLAALALVHHLPVGALAGGSGAGGKRPGAFGLVACTLAPSHGGDSAPPGAAFIRAAGGAVTHRFPCREDVMLVEYEAHGISAHHIASARAARGGYRANLTPFGKPVFA